MLNQLYLDDARWALIASSLPGKEGDPGRHGRDNRLFMEAVFWIVRTGSPWRKLPPQFGHWYTAYARFKRWTLNDIWSKVFSRLAQDGGCEYFYENGVIFYAPLHIGRVCLPRSVPERSFSRRDQSAESSIRIDDSPEPSPWESFAAQHAELVSAESEALEDWRRAQADAL